MNIVVLTTFPDSLIRAKLVPLSRVEGIGVITLVCDQVGPPIPGVRYVVPSPTMYRWTVHKSIAKLVTLFRESKREQPDLIMAYTLFPHGFSAWLVARLMRRPVAVHLTGGYIELTIEKRLSDNSLVRALPVVSGVVQATSRWVVRRCDHVMVPGTVTRQFLLDRLNVRENRIVDLHSTIDVDHFVVGDRAKDFDIVLVAKLRGLKRGEVFIETVDHLRARAPDIRAVIVGDGETKEALRNRVASAGLSDHIHFAGYESDPVGYYQRSRVFLLPSLAEGLSTAVMEGMACGVPAVTSDVGDMKDIVIDEFTGYTVPPSAGAREFSDAVFRLLSDTDAYGEISQNCRDLIVAKRSFPRALKDWTQFLERVETNGAREGT
jgi:glycosyltransferase involved in cell wall biosynthesis